MRARACWWILWTLGMLLLGSAPPSVRAQHLSSTDKQAITQAVLKAVQAHRDRVIGFLIFEVRVAQIEVSPDGNTALAWLHFHDPQTGDLIPSEPGLAIARRVGDAWRITLQADATWNTALNTLPPTLLPGAARNPFYLTTATRAPSAPLTGYLLPWPNGRVVRLSRSISHGGQEVYAFDFYDGTTFPVHAARSGKVKYVVWNYPNGYDDGNCNHANYLVVEDTTTSPTSYAVYLHLAQNSIPQALRTRGAPVYQGQFLGYADDTGCSTGHHLHFQVHTNPYSWYSASVDITFDDVNINGGRPRTVAEANSGFCFPAPCQGRDWYVSGNHTDATPPTGDLTLPVSATITTTSTITITGWAQDDTALGGVQIVAQTGYGGAWSKIGPLFTTSPFTYTWDLCAENVAAGPVSLALQITDSSANLAPGLPGLRHLGVHPVCSPPPPACAPTANQVALHMTPNFGAPCVVLDVGDYTDAAPLLALKHEVASVQVGANVWVTLFDQPNFQGRSETFTTDDRNLSDNRLHAPPLQVQSVRVGQRTDAPFPPNPVWPVSVTLPAEASLTLYAADAGGGTAFQFRHTVPTGTVTSTWQTKPILALHLGVSGTITWTVRAQNTAGVSPWAQPVTFTLTGTHWTPPITATLPYSETFESGAPGWERTGLWRTATGAHHGTLAAVFADTGGTYDTGQPVVGDLTSPPIWITGTLPTLTFAYRTHTEDPNPFWDRREVQISVDGGPFHTLWQGQDEIMDTWLTGQIALSDFISHTVRLRFHFESLDARLNAYAGWAIDDVTVAEGPPVTCPPRGEAEPNDDAAHAQTLTLGATISGTICGAGDVDWFAFQGQTGQFLAAEVEALTSGSPLSATLRLLDADGRSVLAEAAASSDDPVLSAPLPADGMYYLRLSAFDHPSSGGPTYTYTLRLVADPDPPVVQGFNLRTGDLISTSLPLTLTVTDTGSGVQKVTFRWHAANWQGGKALSDQWQTIATDTDGSDGWSTLWDVSHLPEGRSLAVYAIAADGAGHTIGVGAWNLTLDRTPPTVTLTTLAPIQANTTFSLSWTITDALSGPAALTLQYRADHGAWQMLTPLSVTQTMTWFVGQPSTLYDFRLRARDRAGNWSAFTPLATTYVAPCTAPDAWEPDDAPTQAVTVTLPLAQTRSFCVPNDQDWISLTLNAGQTIYVIVQPLHEQTAVEARLYAADGSTLLAGPATTHDGTDVLLTWHTESDQQVLLALRHPDGRIAGPEVQYRLLVTDYAVFLPLIAR